MRRTLIWAALAALIGVMLVALPASASADLRIAKIQFDPPGADNGSNASLNKEYVIIKNSGSSAVTLTAWTLRDADGHVYTFAKLRLGVGKRVRIHTGSAPDTSTNLYWGLDNYIWDNNGDTALLKDAKGHKIDRCTYSGSGSSTNC